MNRLLVDLIIRCEKGNGLIDYFHISILGYGLRPYEVAPILRGPLSGKHIVRISEIADAPIRLEKRIKLGPNGNAVELAYPIWVDPSIGHDSPMSRALREAYRIIRDWINNDHMHSVPPIVFHLTGGEASDGDPSIPAKNLVRLATGFGNVLLFNYCISYVGGDPISYPDDDSMIPDEYGKRLFQMSSMLTRKMHESLIRQNINVKEGARGFVYQSTTIELIRFLDIGTKPAELT